jgi:hypothetical protein
MRTATALATSALAECDLPVQAAVELRRVFDLLPRPGDPHAAVPTLHLGRAGVVLHPHWPNQVQPARLPDGSSAPRRADFYDALRARRRRAQIAARRVSRQDW